MSKMKRAVAIALAAAMTMGSTLTVFAADTTGNGETHGKGENEGHVDKEVINVILPTIPETGSPFDYITDPERLIQSTSGVKYEDYTFPDKDSDKGVYFRVGEKEFSNTSETLQVINKSSCDVKITVTAKATKVGDNDLALATSATTTKDAPLYLNLKVGQTDTPISSADAATSVEKTIAGSADNFEVQYKDGAYEYVPSADAYQWKALNLTMNGAVSDEAVVTNDTTAPTVDVTWAYAKAGEGDSVSTTDQTDYEENAEPEIISISDYIKADPHDIVVKFSLGKGPDAVDADGVKLYQGATKTEIGAAVLTVDMANGTVTIKPTANFFKTLTADLPIYVVLTKEGAKVTELTGKMKVKADYDPQDPEIISITDYVKASPQNVVITFSLGTKDKAVDADGVKVYQGASRTEIGAAALTVDMANGTVEVSTTANFWKSVSADFPIYVVLTKGGSPVTELAGTVKVK